MKKVVLVIESDGVNTHTLKWDTYYDDNPKDSGGFTLDLRSEEFARQIAESAYGLTAVIADKIEEHDNAR